MHTSPYIDQLNLADPDAFREALASEPLEHGLRVTLTAGLQTLASQQSEAVQQQYAAFLEELPELPPFAFMPVSRYVLTVAWLGTLIWPEETLETRIDNTFKGYLEAMRELPLIQKLHNASDGQYLNFEQVLASSPNLAYNFGKRSFERDGQEGATLYFEDYSSALGAYWLVPLQKGIAGLFDTPLDATFTATGPRSCRVEVRL